MILWYNPSRFNLRMPLFFFLAGGVIGCHGGIITHISQSMLQWFGTPLVSGVLFNRKYRNLYDGGFTTPSCHHYDIIPSSTEPTCYCLHGFVYFEFQDTKTSRLDLWSLRCQWFVCVMVLVHSYFSYWQFLGIVIISLGHYDFPCFLVQIGITFTGEIVFAGELLRSTSYDARTFCDEGHFHPQYDWEYNIGDCHYACVENFFTPCAKVHHGG